MIVKMQKVTILVSSKEQERALGALRKLGVVHIKHLKPPLSESILSLEEEFIRLNDALAIIGKSSAKRLTSSKGQIASLTQEIVSLAKQRKDLLVKLKDYNEKLKWFEIWGAVSLSTLKDLANAGIFVKLYICTKRDLKNLAKDKAIQVLKKDRRGVYLALVSTSEKEKLDFPQVQVPDIELEDLKRTITQMKGQLEGIDIRIKEFARYKESFLQYKKELARRIEFHKVKHGMMQEEGFCYLKGFCPKESAGKLKELSSNQGWGYIAEEPKDPAQVPTLIRNPRWLKIIEPVFNFMGTLPGYNEFDISFWFLLFFSLFFAMIIGDAGYGCVFLLASFFLRRKFKSAPKEIFFLINTLSIATIIWGIITGTWFGLEKIAQLPFLNLLVIERLNSFLDVNQMFLIYMCFVIGAIHLSIAHGIIAFRIINSTLALAHLGWISIIWGVFFIAGNLVLGRPIPGIFKIILPLGFALVILFSHPQRNIFKGILISLGALPLKAIGSFSDIISYIRLFAVGYATIMVASAFNDMAFTLGFSSVTRGFMSALILFLGHSLNILLGLLSVIVHGIRLNLLEFSGHLNMEWSGKKYSPFKE